MKKLPLFRHKLGFGYFYCQTFQSVLIWVNMVFSHNCSCFVWFSIHIQILELIAANDEFTEILALRVRIWSHFGHIQSFGATRLGILQP